MTERQYYTLLMDVLLSFLTVLMVAVLYLSYKNRLSGDMIRDLSRDYEQLARNNTQNLKS